MMPPNNKPEPIAAGRLAEILKGSLKGNPDRLIQEVSSPGRGGKGAAVFFFDRRGLKTLDKVGDALLVVPDDQKVVGEIASLKPNQDFIAVKDPELCFVILLETLYPPHHPFRGISPRAVVEAGAKIGPEAAVAPLAYVAAGAEVGARTVIYPHVFVGPGVEIGDDCLIYPNVTIQAECIIGDRVILNPGVVIGADGFGYCRRGGVYRKKPQVGRVVVEDDVEIGANTTIDRATLDETRIGRGTKVDNLAQIAHNVIIGPNVILVGQAGIAGSSKVGEGAVIAAQAGVTDHVTLGEGCIVGGKSGVTKDVPPKVMVTGYPAVEHRKWLRQSNLIGWLPEFRQRLAELETRLKKLEENDAG